jgi:hypothetical protein
MSERLSNEPHKQPPHQRRVLNGVELYTKTCPSCHAEVLVLIHEFVDGRVVRTFCHLCPESKANESMIPEGERTGRIGRVHMSYSINSLRCDSSVV